jgi:uncharacterized protein (TIGR00290 family)
LWGIARPRPALYDTKFKPVALNPFPPVSAGRAAAESDAVKRESVILSWSGGKDSSLTLAGLRGDPRYDVVALLTSVTRGYDRVSIHGVRRELLHAQAAAAGLPLLEIELEPQSSNPAYEAAFFGALDRLRTRFPTATTIAFGDLFLEDVRAYRERLLSGSGFTPLFPIWGRDTRALAEEFIDAGFVAHLVCVDTQQLSANFAGRQFDRSLLVDLPANTDPCGERGEFHTFVSAGPIFEHAIPVAHGEVVLREDRFAFCDLLPAIAAEAPR